jgi:hypothetical protein
MRCRKSETACSTPSGAGSQVFVGALSRRQHNIRKDEMDTYIGTQVVRAVPMTRESVEELLNRNIGCKQAGDGYFVQYDDGYQSWISKEGFNKVYRRTNLLTLGLAIEALLKGSKIARSGWKNKGMWLTLEVPDERRGMTLPCICLHDPNQAVDTPNACIAWVASQADILAEDWQIVERLNE